MNPFENPFYVLGASPRDSRRRLSALAEERAFLSDPEVANEARSELVIPQKRLAAEMRWFPGVGDGKIKEILEALRRIQEGQVVEFPDVEDDEGMHCIASMNCAVYTFSLCPLENNTIIIDRILRIDNNAGFLDEEILYDEINGDRETAGFPAAEEMDIEDEFRSYKEDIVKTLSGKCYRTVIMSP